MLLVVILSLFIVSAAAWTLRAGPAVSSRPRGGAWHALHASTFETDVTPTTTAAEGATTPLPYLQERRPLKTALLALAARTGRGELASERDKDQARELVEKLESYNPTQNPAASELSQGTWVLVFSNTQLFRSSPFFMAARAVCQDGPQAASFNQFCDLHREALAFTQIGRVSQTITPDNKLVSEFESKVAVLPGAPLVVRGTIVSEADIIETASDSWTLFMDRIKIKVCFVDKTVFTASPFLHVPVRLWAMIQGSNLPLAGSLFNNFGGLPIRRLGDLVENATGPRPRPVFRTYYVDTHMRISRDQVRVCVRVCALNVHDGYLASPQHVRSHATNIPSTTGRQFFCLQPRMNASSAPLPVLNPVLITFFGAVCTTEFFLNFSKKTKCARS
jgi:hypothetical protein